MELPNGSDEMNNDNGTQVQRDENDRKPGGLANTPRPPKVQRVIVIGAGIAGLAAARELQERGYDVLVVEARGRLGGRLKSVDLENATSVDIGGALIHGIDDNPIYDVVTRELGIDTQAVSDCLLLSDSGWPVDPKNDEKTSTLFNECLEESFQEVQEATSQRHGAKKSFGAIFRSVCSEKHVNCHDEIFRWHQANLELSCGAGFDQLGYLWNEDEPFGFDGEHVAIPSSWASVCKALADPLHVIYDQPVASIEIVENLASDKVIPATVANSKKATPPKTPTRQETRHATDCRPTPSRQSRRLRGEEPSQRKSAVRDRKPVNYFTVDHSVVQQKKKPDRLRQEKPKVNVRLESGHTLQADAVVCTVPLGVLKRKMIQFDPPLPSEKQKAIQRLGLGLLNKCAISFPNRFWPESEFLGLADQANSYLILNGASFTDHPVLIFLFGGSFAKTVEGWTDNEVVADCMRVLTRICSRAVPMPVDYQVTRWGCEQHSFMSFTYVPPGVDGGRELATLSNPIESKTNGCPLVMFAGEHTTKFHPSTIHGAFLSGIREAYRLDCFISPEENDQLQFSSDEVYYPTFPSTPSDTSTGIVSTAIPTANPGNASLVRDRPPTRGPRRGTRVQIQQSHSEKSRGKISHGSLPIVQSPTRRSPRSKRHEDCSVKPSDSNELNHGIKEMEQRIVKRSILSFGNDHEFIASMILPVFGDDAQHKLDDKKKICRRAASPYKKKHLPQRWLAGNHRVTRLGGFRLPTKATLGPIAKVKTRSGRISKPILNLESSERGQKRKNGLASTKTRSGRKVIKPNY